ncbi:MAG: hypothetical protein HY244_18935 [Rhizobiales bacterium]|nr:hypothetical protein [Hyphomicrobiales bacterium]
MAILSAVTVMAAGAARAENAGDTDAFAKRMFAGNLASQGKSYACFTRRYDAAHLARHPQQKTTAMKLLVSAETVPEDQALNYSFSLGVKFSDRKGNFDSSGSCGHPTASQDTADKLTLGCGVDCDGGGLSVEMVNADKSVMVRLERLAIWNNDKPDEERTGFNAGADDRAFRLDRVGLDECKSLMPKKDELAALDEK